MKYEKDLLNNIIGGKKLSNFKSVSKKLFLAILICYSATILSGFEVLIPNWTHLKVVKNYPQFEEVNKENLSDAEASAYKLKNSSYFPSYKNAFSLEEKHEIVNHSRDRKGFVSLIDSKGNKLWSKPFNRNYIVNLTKTGISTFSNYDNWNSLVWFNRNGKEINRINFDNKKKMAFPTPLKDGQYWMIKVDYLETGEDYQIERNAGNLLSMIFTDKFGNILNKIKLKYPDFDEFHSISTSEDYLFISCTEGRPGKPDYKYHSYFLNANGSIINEYNTLVSRGFFSKDESMYCANGKFIDTSTGELLFRVPAKGPCKPANRGTNLFVVAENNVLRIINYQTRELLFQKEFEQEKFNCEIKYVEISGDGKTVKAMVRGIMYTFEYNGDNLE